MRRLPTLAALSLPLAFAIACGSGSDPDFKDVLPDDRVKINMPTDDNPQARVGEVSQYFVFTANVTDSVNGLAGYVLVLVGTVSALPPTWVDEAHTQATWGPYAGALDAVETQMWATHNADDSYDWGFDQRPKNDDTAEWTPVVVGHVEPGATHEASRGDFLVDWTAMAGIDPTQHTTGSFGVAYDIGTDGVTGTATFDQVQWEAQGVPMDAMYAYEQVAGGSGAMDLVLETDMDDTESTAEETLYVRSRWEQTGVGRSDAVLTGGDLNELTATATDCWGLDFTSVYYADNYTPIEEGDAAECAFAAPEYNELAP
jgi:hypothetical protein